jgi:hypothetical protein
MGATQIKDSLFIFIFAEKRGIVYTQNTLFYGRRMLYFRGNKTLAY